MKSSLVRLLFVLALSVTELWAAVPPPPGLLPGDTLAVLTAPDVAKLRAAMEQSAEWRLWNDPSIRPFRDRLEKKFQEDVVKKLEQELGVKLADYAQLLQGQATLAVLPNGWPAESGAYPAWLMVLDSGDKAEDLKRAMAEIVKKQGESGKSLRRETIQGTEFLVIHFSPKDLVRSLEEKSSAKESAAEGKSATAEKSPAASEGGKTAEQPAKLYVGQVGGLLLVGSAAKALERVCGRLNQSGTALAEQEAFDADYRAYFRESLAYGWVNFRPLAEALRALAKAGSDAQGQKNPTMPAPDKILGTSGLLGLRSFGFRLDQSVEGAFRLFYLNVPAANREGLFKLLAYPAKESGPPPFVSTDVTKFDRWRLDGQKFWGDLEQLVQALSPQLGGLLQMSLAALGKDKDPNYDFKRSFVGNLGDDVITLQKPPRGTSLAELSSPPTLFLLGSPKPDELARAIKTTTGLLPMATPDSALKEREFLGRKVYVFPLPSLPVPGNDKPVERAVQFAASGGYLAFSTDAAFLEEYLRNSENSAQPLRNLAGLSEAAQKVNGTAAGLFGFENYSQTIRMVFEVLRQDPQALFNMIPSLPGQGADERKQAMVAIKEWVDFTLLPPFDRVAKYFHFSVKSGAVADQGFQFRFFSPTPPEVKADLQKKTN